MTIIAENSALMVKALQNYKQGETEREAGENYLVMGPCVYYPRIEETVVSNKVDTIIPKGCALKLRAEEDFKDRSGAERIAGEEWLVT